MARKPRTDFEGAWHHIGNRGVDRRRIFDDDYDRRTFISILCDTFVELDTELHAYCLMSNHYHLLTHTPTASLSVTMQQLSSRYTMAYNKRHKRDGPLFKGRFWSSLLSNSEHTLEVSRYIHRNSLDLGQAGQLARYDWSSYRSYVGLARRPRWLTTDFVLTAGSFTMRQYQEYVEQDRPADSAAMQMVVPATCLLSAAAAVAENVLVGTSYCKYREALILTIATDQGTLNSVDLSAGSARTAASIRGKVLRFRNRLAHDPTLALLAERACQTLKTNTSGSDPEVFV